MSTQAFICDAIRTPFGRYAGALSSVRTDDLGAIPIKALMARNPKVDWQAVADVIYGCANQAGEDNRNVARMSRVLAGLPIEVPGATINRLCGSGMDAVGIAARAIKAGEAQLMIAGGRRKHEPRALRDAEGRERLQPRQRGLRHDDRLALRQQADEGTVRRRFDAETGENVATDYRIERAAQDRMALASQQKAVAAQKAGFFDAEITPVTIAQKKGEPIVVVKDEHPRETQPRSTRQAEGRGAARRHRDGRQCVRCERRRVCAAARERSGCGTPWPRAARPRRRHGHGRRRAAHHGHRPAPATRKVLELTGLALSQIDVIELNEAFAAQGLAVLRDLGLADDDARVNANGGAIALGHPLGASGARLVTTAVNQLHRISGRYALCTMCIGVGQGIAMIVERV